MTASIARRLGALEAAQDGKQCGGLVILLLGESSGDALSRCNVTAGAGRGIVFVPAKIAAQEPLVEGAA